MVLLVWIDVQILKFFTKIAKDFNWLTGKDNFFLARVSIVLSSCCLIANGILLRSWFFFVLLGILHSAYYFYLTSLVEDCSLKEQLLGIKFRIKAIVGLGLRFFLLCVSAPYFYVGLMYANEYRKLFIGLFFMLIFCWKAFVDIDRPPFKKSQARQKIKSLLSSLVTKPQVEPITVQIN